MQVSNKADSNRKNNSLHNAQIWTERWCKTKMIKNSLTVTNIILLDKRAIGKTVKHKLTNRNELQTRVVKQREKKKENLSRGSNREVKKNPTRIIWTNQNVRVKNAKKRLEGNWLGNQEDEATYYLHIAWQQ